MQQKGLILLGRECEIISNPGEPVGSLKNGGWAEISGKTSKNKKNNIFLFITN